ncbi:hypothetical protein VTN96DRAFT_2954 [Rasamsonia emersonii]
MGQWETKRLPVWRRLGNNRFVDESRRTFVGTDESRLTLIRSRQHQARSAVGGMVTGHAIRTDGASTTVLTELIDGRGGRGEQTRSGTLAGHRRRLRSQLPATHRVGAGESRGRGQKARAFTRPVRHGRLGQTRAGPIDVVRPVFDLLGARLGIRGHGRPGRGIFARQEPLEEDGHDELGDDNGQDEDQRHVQDHFRSDAAHRLGVDGAHFDDLLETLAHLLVGRGLKGVRHVGAPNVGVQPQFIEAGWVRHLRLVEPPQEVQIEHVSGIHHEVAALVLQVIPREVDVA